MNAKNFVSLAAVLCLAGVTWGAEAKADGKTIQVTWVPLTAELAGQKLPDEVLKTIKLTLGNGSYTAQVGKGTDKGTIVLNAAKKPKEIDIKGTEGPNKGKTFLAIYELSDDSLKVCYDLSGKTRPTEFRTSPNTQLYLVVYKRDKP